MTMQVAVYCVPRSRTFVPMSAQVLQLIRGLADGGWIPEVYCGQAARDAQGTDCHHGVATSRQEHAFPDPITAEWLETLIAEKAGAGLVLSWENSDHTAAGLRYPLWPGPVAPEAAFAIRFQFTREYLCRFAGDGMSDEDYHVDCPCGAPLWREVRENLLIGTRLVARCPQCGTDVDPSRFSVGYTDPFTGETRRSNGGTAARFAFLVDCGADHPRHDPDDGRGFFEGLMARFRGVPESPKGPKLTDELRAVLVSAMGCEFDELILHT